MRTLKKIIIYILGILLLLICIGICAVTVDVIQWLQEPFNAFGDGGSIRIPITPENALSVGDSVKEGDILISLLGTGQYTDTEDLEALSPGWEYWYVIIVLQNLSSNNYWINPLGESRIQGMLTQTQRYSYPYSDFGGATTDWLGRTTSELAPGEAITTTLIYKVPLENDLFWIFGERNNPNAVFQVR